MEELGITVLRFSDSEVFNNLDQVVLNIDGWIENYIDLDSE
jgi:very-short-patch-repair endonuclease